MSHDAIAIGSNATGTGDAAVAIGLNATCHTTKWCMLLVIRQQGNNTIPIGCSMQQLVKIAEHGKGKDIGCSYW